jgi:hypothetical protein
MNDPINLLVDIETTAAATTSKAMTRSMKEKGIGLDLVPLDSISSSKEKKGGKGKTRKTVKYLASSNISSSDLHPWDFAQMTLHQQKKNMRFAEPDLDNCTFYHEVKKEENLKAFFKDPVQCAGDRSFDPDWQPNENKIWHLDDGFSQLASARNTVANLQTGTVRIVHFDTGYDGNRHSTQPPNLNLGLQRNFVRKDDPSSAVDVTPRIKINMPGHGTATLALLAGNKVKIGNSFNDFIGGASFADVVPVRISNCVVLDGGITTIFKTSAFYAALRYVIDQHDAGNTFHVLSMSMGGVASKSWAGVVNEAYEKGIVLVTAAGNNFNGVPTRYLVYPARFNRVIAACGVTFDYKPYFHKKLGEMQGNWGPAEFMDTAISSFTPNTPWAIMGCRDTISFSGAGTSSATPQVAAAAACIWKKYKPQLDNLPGWQKAEAVRQLLFRSAKTNFADYLKLKFGRGVIQVMDAINMNFPDPSSLVKAEEDKVRSFYIDLLSGIFKVRTAAKGKAVKKIPFNKELLNLELTQIIQQDYNLEKDFEKLKTVKGNTLKNQKKVIEQIIESKKASNTLKLYLKGIL